MENISKQREKYKNVVPARDTKAPDKTGQQTMAQRIPTRRIGLRTATVFTVYGHRNTATVTVPWPNLSTQSRFGVGTVECRICRRYAAECGRIRPCSYSEIDAPDPEIAV
jgi:hypothetical protein